MSTERDRTTYRLNRGDRVIVPEGKFRGRSVSMLVDEDGTLVIYADDSIVVEPSASNSIRIRIK